MQTDQQHQYLEIPTEKGPIRIVIGIGEDDFQLLLKALELFKDKLIAKPTFTNNCGLP